MKNRLIAIFIVLITAGILVTVSILSTSTANVPDSPSSAKYVLKQWTEGNPTLIATSDILPEQIGNVVRITNYWVLRQDEEGDTQWIRREEDFYYVLLPIREGVITVRQIKDGKLDETILVYEGE